MDSNSQPLGYRPSALAIDLNSSKAMGGKELSLSSWSIASLHIYNFSTVVDFLSEKYSGSIGHRNSWYQNILLHLKEELTSSFVLGVFSSVETEILFRFLISYQLQKISQVVLNCQQI